MEIGDTGMEQAETQVSRGSGWLLPLLLLLLGLQAPESPASALPGPAGTTESVTFTDLAALHQQAQAFLAEQVERWPAEETRYIIHLDPPDERLRLVECGENLTLSNPPQGIAPGRIAVRVSCAGVQPWNIYMTGRIQALRQVLVTTRPMGRGEVIGQPDIMLIEQELDKLRRGYFTEPADVIGMVVKRPIPVNRVVETRAIAMPRLIRRGEAVQIVAENDSVRVQMEGVALSDGALGDRIQVRNRRSGRVVSAVVHGTGQVNVPL